MATFRNVDPTSFINESRKEPASGRGAWSRAGIDFDYRYAMSADPAQRIGTRAEVSLSHWAVAAGTYAIQLRLMSLDFLDELVTDEQGVFGPRTEQAVKAFQAVNKDPDGAAQLVTDGTVGRSDARALFAPMLRKAERDYSIPRGYLIGQSNHESALDPGAVGYYIYYADNETGWLEYRGVDRGISQINSKFNPQVSWVQAYTPRYSFDWSAKRLSEYYAKYKAAYPRQDEGVLWDAALCAHNNPWAGGQWAKNGFAPTDQAKSYVASVKNAIF